jgi:hypothetical protein
MMPPHPPARDVQQGLAFSKHRHRVQSLTTRHDTITPLQGMVGSGSPETDAARSSMRDSSSSVRIGRGARWNTRKTADYNTNEATMHAERATAVPGAMPLTGCIASVSSPPGVPPRSCQHSGRSGRGETPAVQYRAPTCPEHLASPALICSARCTAQGGPRAVNPVLT